MQKPKSSAPAEPEPIERWTAQRKAAITLEVLKGEISVLEAARKYGFTQGDYRKWTDEFMRGGIEALKVNRKDVDSEHRSEVHGCKRKSANS